MHLKKISAMIMAGLIILLPLTSCGKDESEPSEETVGSTVETSGQEEPEVEENSKIRGTELGQMYAIEELASTDINPFGANGEGLYDTDQLLDPKPLVFRDDFLITPCYTGAYGYSVFMGIDIFEFETGKQRNVQICSSDVLMYVTPFECNDELYVCLQSSTDPTDPPVFYAIPFNDSESEPFVTDAFDKFVMDNPNEYRDTYDVLDIYTYEDATMMVVGTYVTNSSASGIKIITNIEEEDPEVLLWNNDFVPNIVTDDTFYGDDMMENFSDYAIVYRGAFRADDGVVLTSFRSATELKDDRVMDYRLRTFDLDRMSFTANKGYYVNTLEGLYQVNGSGNEKKILDYNCVIGDPTLLYYGTFLKEKDGVFYFVSDTFNSDYEKTLELTYNDNLQVKRHVFTVSPVDNPYAERTVLDMVSSDGDIDVLRNIYEFNRTNSDYYVRLTLLDGSVPGSCVEENISHDLPFVYLNSVNSYINYMYRLAQFEKLWKVYVSKNKPDLLYGMPLQEGMCNDRYCLPLQDMLDLKSDNLMESVIERDTAMHDGNLYRMPLWFTYSCLTIDPLSDLDTSLIDNKELISFEEYDDVKQSSNTPCRSFFFMTDSAEGFISLFSNEFDHYIDMKNGEHHLDGSSFRSLASYFMDWHDYDVTYSVSEDMPYERYIYQLRCNSVPAFFHAPEEGDGALLSHMWTLPSNFKTGYGAELTAAVAIGANTDEAEGAVQVIDFLISDEQVMPSSNLSFSINRDVTKKVNDSLKSILGYGTDELIDQYFDKMMDKIEKLDHICMSDYEIFDSVLRYMPDILEGNLTLNEYSKATSTIAEKVLNEK